MNLHDVREQFPITKTKIGDKNLIYFDHAASTHAPTPVLRKFIDVMETTYANVHRGEHTLSCLSTEMFEEVPQKLASYIGENNLANSGSQIVLSSNTTSSLDLASHLFAEQEGAVLTTLMEHHSNDLPHRRRGDVLHADVMEDGRLDWDDFEQKLNNNKIKLVAISAGSNVTGYIPPVNKIARMAHNVGAKILVDAAQRLAHQKINVKPLDHPEHIDFLAGAGHKTYAPFGASFLFGDVQIFDEAEPYIPAGGTVALVTEDVAIYLKGPERHSFGTPNIAGSIAFGASVDFLGNIGIDKIRAHELELLNKMLSGLRSIDGVEIYGDIPLQEKLGVVTFNIGDIYHADVSSMLDKMGGIATRNGCFCAHPYLLKLLNVVGDERLEYQLAVQEGQDPKKPGAVRASIGIYNNEDEVDTFLQVVEQIARP